MVHDGLQYVMESKSWYLVSRHLKRFRIATSHSALYYDFKWNHLQRLSFGQKIYYGQDMLVIITLIERIVDENVRGPEETFV